MTFSDLHFTQRFGAMGDEAEAVYEAVLPLGPSDIFGWRRPDVSMQNMTDKIRYKPDFYAGSGHLVEVMGCNGPLLRGMKVDKWEAMKDWNSDQPMAYFLWNRKLQRWALVFHAAMITLVGRARREGIKAFEVDGNRYFEIKWDDITEAASLIGHATT